jgi:hypothetical protein
MPVSLATRVLAMTLAGFGLSGCAMVGPQTSYIEPMASPADSSVLAGGIGYFMVSRFPPTSTIISLDPPLPGQENNELTPVLAATLQGRGFQVSPAGSAAPGAHTLRYWVTPLDSSGELVRLMIDGDIACSRFYVRNTAGGLQSGGPFTVTREATL